MKYSLLKKYVWGSLLFNITFPSHNFRDAFKNYLPICVAQERSFKPANPAHETLYRPTTQPSIPIKNNYVSTPYDLNFLINIENGDTILPDTQLWVIGNKIRIDVDTRNRHTNQSLKINCASKILFDGVNAAHHAIVMSDDAVEVFSVKNNARKGLCDFKLNVIPSTLSLHDTAQGTVFSFFASPQNQYYNNLLYICELEKNFEIEDNKEKEICAIQYFYSIKPIIYNLRNSINVLFKKHEQSNYKKIMLALGDNNQMYIIELDKSSHSFECIHKPIKKINYSDQYDDFISFSINQKRHGRFAAFLNTSGQVFIADLWAYGKTILKLVHEFNIKNFNFENANISFYDDSISLFGIKGHDEIRILLVDFTPDALQIYFDALVITKPSPKESKVHLIKNVDPKETNYQKRWEEKKAKLQLLKKEITQLKEIAATQTKYKGFSLYRKLLQKVCPEHSIDTPLAKEKKEKIKDTIAAIHTIEQANEFLRNLSIQSTELAFNNKNLTEKNKTLVSENRKGRLFTSGLMGASFLMALLILYLLPIEWNNFSSTILNTIDLGLDTIASPIFAFLDIIFLGYKVYNAFLSSILIFYLIVLLKKVLL
jgi:hypothetical protein